jgi:hypothetical protein
MAHTEPTIAILGSGTAAAFAYYACREAGFTPTIYTASYPLAHNPGGAFWFHDIPTALKAAVQPYPIEFVPLGSGITYSRNLWGEHYTSSFPHEAHTVQGYKADEVLPMLWHGCDRTPWVRRQFESDQQIADLAKGYDLVFQTFPTFHARRTKPALRPITICERLTTYSRNIVYYNGLLREDTDQPCRWLRMSILWDHVYLEVPTCYWTRSCGHYKTTAYKLHPTTKPENVSVADNVVLVGRFATWTRKLLAHQVYDRVASELNWRGLGQAKPSTTN